MMRYLFFRGIVTCRAVGRLSFFFVDDMNFSRIDLLRTGALVLFVVLLLGFPIEPALAATPSSTVKADAVMNEARPRVQKQLQRKGFVLGQPIFVRIFKIPGVLELWMDKGRGFELFKTYRVCNYSGYPGPKFSEGDWQAPEGFYSVSAGRMNPRSHFHLAFDVGYPNAYDAAHNRTGGMIMVHGSCDSVGCFAMTNERMEEIYLLAHAALANGQDRFDVHIFPFPLTQRNLRAYAASPWIQFWRGLAPGYEAFERSHRVPRMAVEGGRYVAYASGATQGTVAQTSSPMRAPQVRDLVLQSGRSQEMINASASSRPVQLAGVSPGLSRTVQARPTTVQAQPTLRAAESQADRRPHLTTAPATRTPRTTGVAVAGQAERKAAVQTPSSSGKTPKIAARKTRANMFEQDR
ncbi:MAG: L,D-transpeptidase family protein [Desulfobulbus sp.]|jgi:murein L,D-transpeptidase YafK